MTALEDMLAKADQVLALDEIRKLAERALQPPRRDGGPNPAPDLARFAIAVFAAIGDLRDYDIENGLTSLGDLAEGRITYFLSNPK